MYFEINKKNVYASTGGKPFTKDQPLVLFIHGSGLDHTFWGLHSRFFAFRNYSVLCLDTPGHTNSDGPALNSIEEMGDWVNDVITHLDAKQISIVVILRLACYYTHCLRHCVSALRIWN